MELEEALEVALDVLSEYDPYEGSELDDPFCAKVVERASTAHAVILKFTTHLGAS
jgi:hypothetical protein